MECTFVPHQMASHPEPDPSSCRRKKENVMPMILLCGLSLFGVVLTLWIFLSDSKRYYQGALPTRFKRIARFIPDTAAFILVGFPLFTLAESALKQRPQAEQLRLALFLFLGSFFVVGCAGIIIKCFKISIHGDKIDGRWVAITQEVSRKRSRLLAVLILWGLITVGGALGIVSFLLLLSIFFTGSVL
jgi:hypothetical protein